MPVSPNFLEFVLDQLSGLGSVRSRRMFGGIGLYCGDTFFGIVDDDIVYFKVDDSNRDDYTARGCEPFRPFGDETTSMSYFRVPSDVFEDVDDIKAWARKALTVATSAAAAKAFRSKRPRTAKRARSKAKKR
jgi:DNA transformation protein and related proteins